jgi:hypothetical protein
VPDFLARANARSNAFAVAFAHSLETRVALIRHFYARGYAKPLGAIKAGQGRRGGVATAARLIFPVTALLLDRDHAPGHESMRPPKPNSIEPPWYGPVCPVVWEGWRREASPYPDPAQLADILDEWRMGQIDPLRTSRRRARPHTAVRTVSRDGRASEQELVTDKGRPGPTF